MPVGILSRRSSKACKRCSTVTVGLNVDGLISASAFAHRAMTGIRRRTRRRMGESRTFP